MNHIDSLSIPIDGELRHDFIVDCARFAEGILTEKAVKKKYLFDAETWERLGSDEALIEAIEVEKHAEYAMARRRVSARKFCMQKHPPFLATFYTTVAHRRGTASKVRESFGRLPIMVRSSPCRQRQLIGF
jgi:hypothetical protein